MSGALHKERATISYACHGVVTDRVYFWFEFISNSDPHWNLSDQLQSQAWNNVGMSTCSREAALFCPHRSVHMQTGTGLFRGENI